MAWVIKSIFVNEKVISFQTKKGFSIRKVERQNFQFVKKVNDLLQNFSSIGILNCTLNP